MSSEVVADATRRDATIGRHFHRAATAAAVCLTLAGVLSCADDHSVGSAITAPTTDQLAAASNPWTTIPSPNRGSLTNDLKAVAVGTAGDVWAVGEWNPGPYPAGAERHTLVERWNGSSWQVVPSPNAPGAFVSTLEGVEAASDGSVWAVGYGDGYGTLQATTLVLRWNGAQWNRVQSPNPSGSSLPNRLYDLVVVAPNDIWAVGEQDFRVQGYPYRALILHWDGTSWRNVPNNCGRSLYAITLVPPGTLWTVGESTTCRYNGQSWVRVPPAEAAGFRDVSGVSSSFIWAVGQQVFCDPWTCYGSSVIERFNGSSWTPVTHPLFSTVNGVVALTAADAWAVGDSGAVGASLHWNGTSWTQVQVPNVGNGSSLNALAAIGATRTWAVGHFYNQNGIARTWTVRR